MSFRRSRTREVERASLRAETRRARRCARGFARDPKPRRQRRERQRTSKQQSTEQKGTCGAVTVGSLVLGRRAKNITSPERTRVTVCSYVFRKFHLNPRQTVRSLIHHPLELHSEIIRRSPLFQRVHHQWRLFRDSFRRLKSKLVSTKTLDKSAGAILDAHSHAIDVSHNRPTMRSLLGGAKKLVHDRRQGLEGEGEAAAMLVIVTPPRSA